SPIRSHVLISSRRTAQRCQDVTQPGAVSTGDSVGASRHRCQHEEVTQSPDRAPGRAPARRLDAAQDQPPGVVTHRVLTPGVLAAERDMHAWPFGVLVNLVAGGDVVILSGAGLSTESGIPDYRGPSGRARRAEPMTYQTFVATAAARQRYWARSHLGWRHVARARPNAGHYAVAELEQAGLLAGTITQNVDGLHQEAGAQQVIELHGSLSRVLCLGCGKRTPRPRLDQRLRAANSGWAARAAEITPDGDAVLADDDLAGVRVG